MMAITAVLTQVLSAPMRQTESLSRVPSLSTCSKGRFTKIAMHINVKLIGILYSYPSIFHNSRSDDADVCSILACVMGK